MTQPANARGKGDQDARQDGGQSDPLIAAQRQAAPAMTDPVCGKPVALASPHSFVFNGALFCFCSAECWAQFLVEPARYVRLEAAAKSSLPRAEVTLVDATRAAAATDQAATDPQTPESRITRAAPTAHKPTEPIAIPAAVAVVAGPVPVERPMDQNIDRIMGRERAPAPLAFMPTPGPKLTPTSTANTMHKVIAVFDEKHGSNIDTAQDRAFATAAPNAGTLPPVLAASMASGGGIGAGRLDWLTAQQEQSLLARARGLLATPLTFWRQIWHAAAVSRQLLKLHAFVSERHPDLKGRALYRQIVMVRSGTDVASADRMLDRAEQSFAQWPAQRELRFADVVHYLAVEEFFAAHGETHWTHAHMGRVVAARIPAGL